jgi:hypothetical protein
VCANGSESILWIDDTSESVKREQTSTKHVIFCAGTGNGFVSVASSIFVSGAKLGDNLILMNGVNFEH